MKNLFWIGICTFTVVCGLSSCQSEAELTGTWLEPVPGIENMQQGFCLEKNGKASSVNMATLQYQSWKQDGEKLLLQGVSIGNGTSFEFTDTMNIEKITEDSLILKRGNFSLKYKKQK